MVDTAIFGIFHRGLPSRPSPVEAAPPQAAPAAAALPSPEPVVSAPAAPPVEPEPVIAPAIAEVHAAPAHIEPAAEPAPSDPILAEAPHPEPAAPLPHRPNLAAAPAQPAIAEPDPPPEAIPDAAALPEPAFEPELAPEPEMEFELAPVFEAELAATADEAGLEAADHTNYAEPESDLPQDLDQPTWPGHSELRDIDAAADQLGLANPAVITVFARLADFAMVELDASHSGIYRPRGFRAAPWSGFAYDQAEDGRTGLAAGTRILTSRGEMEVEKLLPGDTALTLRAPALLPIAWIGKSTATVAPILIEAGALGPNLPRRPLCLAPDQAVYVEPVPVPAARLVNGTSIRPLDSTLVDLFHVDVGKAEILFAEGLPLSSSDRNRLQAVQ